MLLTRSLLVANTKKVPTLKLVEHIKEGGTNMDEGRERVLFSNKHIFV
jgi:hypothetical protein